MEKIFDKCKYIAHRGLHDEKLGIIENSIEAFKQAIKYNYAIELDVNITKDNKVVVFHDYWLKRLTGNDNMIKNVEYKYIQTLRLKNTDSKIPLFKDVLNLVNGKVPLLIEIKNEGLISKLEIEVIKELKDYSGYVLVHSFNPLTVKYFKKNTSYKTGILTSKKYDKFKASVMGTIINNYLAIKYISPDFISCKYEDINTNTKDQLKKRKIPYFVWTIKTNEDYLKVKNICDGIIFENIMPNI